MNIILDPILKEIDIESNTLKIINSSAFQRLGRIKQTGNSIYAFPGLSQTRMSHSLGIYGICQYLLNYNENIQKYLTKYEQLVLKYSALLHDIGHGPYSHFFERLTNINHEDFSVHIIMHDHELNQILKKIHRNLPRDICRVLLKRHSNSVMLKIISSHVDIDRMDYLMRDSYYSGLNHGQIDFRYILRNIGIRNDDIYFNEVAINSIENFLIARYHMYQSIYYNIKTECFEQLIIKIFERILYLYKKNKISRNNEFLNIYFNLLGSEKDVFKYPINEYLKTDDYTFFSFIIWFSNSNDGVLKILIDDFLHHRRFNFISLKNKTKQGEMEVIKARLVKLFGQKDAKFLYSEATNTSYSNRHLSFFKTKSISKPPILIRRKDSTAIASIMAFSKVIKALNIQFTKRKRAINRFYYWKKRDE